MRTYLLNVPSIFFNTVRLLAGWPMVVFVSWVLLVVLHRYTSFTIFDFMLASIFCNLIQTRNTFLWPYFYVPNWKLTCSDSNLGYVSVLLMVKGIGLGWGGLYLGLGLVIKIPFSFHVLSLPVLVVQREEEKLRAAIRRESQQRRVRERHTQRGLTASYLEPDRCLSNLATCASGTGPDSSLSTG